MNKQIKKMLAAALSLAMVAGSIVLPTMASADEYTPLVAGDTVLKEWKFDFGAADSTPEAGYTLVTPDTNFTTNPGKDANNKPFGFLGTDEEDYKLTDRYDGWATQKGQKIELAAGGGTGLNDAIGVIGAGGTGENAGADIFGNKADKYYPTRFALKVEDDKYYRIKATVTTLDPAKDATVSLYTERKHPLYTEKHINAGEVEELTFSVRVTPIYYEKSTPTGTIKDEMVTVGVLGENSALASVEIQQVETIPTLWVLGDSTVTDGNTTLPFFLLQNYTGVGTGLTKYLRRDYAMVNEGEGGLTAADNNHFNMVKSRIKEGDYMYVEYGHNHKADGPTGYKACLDKYYDACHSVGAKLIIVSPVQSDNDWDDTNKKWKDRFGGETNFAGVGKAWVAEKVEAGATDVAFADLTKTSVEFVDKVTEEGGNLKTAAQFYYQVPKGGSADVSHPNDTGAENFAYCFFEAAKENEDATQAAVLADLLANMTDEQPNPVPEDVVAGGLGGTAWPVYIVPTTEKYPIVIDNVEFNEDGTAKQVDVTVRDAEIPFVTYGIIVITIYNADGTEKGKIYAVDQVDHSTSKGPQKVVNFRGDVTLAEGDSYSAVVVEALDSNDGLQVVEGGTVYSAVYTPTDIDEYLILNEDGDGAEKFDYFGATYDGATDQLSGNNGWRQIGSAGITTYLNEAADGTKYVEFVSDGAKGGSAGQGSFYYDKALSKEIGTTGRYVVSADMQIVSGGGLTLNLVNGHSDKNLGGTESLSLLTVGANGAVTAGGQDVGAVSATGFTNVKYVLDMDLGTAEVTVGGGDTVVIDLTNYQTTELTVTPEKLTQFMFGGSKVAFDVKVANLTVAKLEDKPFPEYKFTVKTEDKNKGKVSLGYVVSTAVPIATDEPTVNPTEAPVATAEPDATEAPAATAAPDATKAPAATAEPDSTETPAATAAPDATEAPAATAEPDATEAPAATAAPDATEAPVDASSVELFAAVNVKMEYADGKATVTFSDAGEAVLIEAIYAEGALKTVKTTPLKFETAGEQSVSVSEGSKLMLWNSLKDMKPIIGEPIVVPAATEAPSPVPAVNPNLQTVSETLALNTVVTAKAEANKGYVFMGWADESGKVVSMEDEYTFRLRGDTELTAKFAKEPGVEDIVSYSLDAEKKFIKNESDASTEMIIVNPVDKEGTPMSKVTNADIEWSSSDENVLISKDGKVTLDSGFSMDGVVEKEVTVIGKLNGISETCVITFHDYDSMEDFSAVSDAWGFEGAGGTAVENGALTLLKSSSSSGSSVQTKTLDQSITSAKKAVVKFDWKSQVESGKGRHSNFVLMDSSDKPIFGLRGAGTGGLYYSTKLAAGNGDTDYTSFSSFNQNWYTIKLTIDFEAKTINGTIAETSTGKVIKTIENEPIPNEAANLGKLYAVNTYSLAPMAIDNVCFKAY